jgi:NAD(P)-dependent dehydrogenase (short-subunit alcohol dehydrogenase family)
LELTRQILARGDRVFAGCRSPDRASDLEELAAKYPGMLTILPLEVTNEESIARCAAIVAAEAEALDVLFNNAAINMGDENLSDVRPDDLLKTLHVNAIGPILVAQGFVPLLKKSSDPKIINISSEAGSISKMRAFRGYGYYGSKAAENMYTRSLAWDPDTEGITIIAIHPGWVRTEMGGEDADISPEESAAGIIKVTDWLTAADNGKFYTWEGFDYPW